MVIGGSFGQINNALLLQKTFEELGYRAEIKKTDEDLYQVVVGQTKTYIEAQEMVNILNEIGHKVWINQCDCCKLTEEDHLQNRRTDFKIIRL